MQLKDWLTSKGMTQAAFAELIGSDQSTISRLIPEDGKRQTRKPSIDLAARIEAATGGAVTANDFVPRPQVADGVNDLRPVAASGDDDADALGKGAAA